MSNLEFLEVLLGLWPRFPTLVGESWPNLQPQLLQWLEQFEQAENKEEEARWIMHIEDELESQAPDVLALLYQALEDLAMESYLGEDEAGWSLVRVRGEGVIPISGDRRRIREGVSDLVHGPGEVIRYTDVRCDRRMAVGQEYAVYVSLTRQAVDEEAKALKIQPTEVQVYMLYPQEDWVLLGNSYQTIPVLAEADSPPILFRIRPRRPGTKHFHLVFLQNDVYLKVVPLEVEVTEEAIDEAELLAYYGLLPLERSFPPDMLLLVFAEEEQLRFVVHSGREKLGCTFQDMGTQDLHRDPAAFAQALAKEMNAWTRSGSLPEDRWQRELRDLGLRLFRDLFPQKLQDFFWSLPDDVRTLQILSDEPWIPWEMLRAQRRRSDGRTEEDERFFCERFALTRWLFDHGSPAVGLHLRPLALVAPPAGPDETELPAQQEEAESLRLCPGVDQEPANLAELEQVLAEGDLGVLHFACHGMYDPEDPLEGAALSVGGERFYPRIIEGERRNVGIGRPLVFVNSCEGGRGEFSLTGLGGWVEAFLAAGVGSFVGSMWEVRDKSAAEFARVFYEALAKRMSLAEAMLQARREIKKLGGPTWLSYCLYGNPWARVVKEE
ncbi:MAG: CHAT domain-containing protein [Chloroflexia bacterium]|nr:CHAT domain-containing protein [Chloroflexia bacterium]